MLQLAQHSGIRCVPSVVLRKFNIVLPFIPGLRQTSAQVSVCNVGFFNSKIQRIPASEL